MWQVGKLESGREGATHLEHASLREDYLIQVQRDCLSQANRPSTPSEVPRACTRNAADYARSADRSQTKARVGGPSKLCCARSDQSNTGDSTPSTLCSLGLVVVYCSGMRLSGNT